VSASDASIATLTIRLWAQAVTGALAVNQTFLDALLESQDREKAVSSAAGSVTTQVGPLDRATALRCSDLVLQNDTTVISGDKAVVDPVDVPTGGNHEVVVHLPAAAYPACGNYRGHLVDAADGSQVGRSFWVFVSPAPAHP
jgi:hypothetical protein